MKLVGTSGKKEYLKAKIYDLETNIRIKYVRDFNRGINDFKKGYQPRINNFKEGLTTIDKHSRASSA